MIQDPAATLTPSKNNIHIEDSEIDGMLENLGISPMGIMNPRKHGPHLDMYFKMDSNIIGVRVPLVNRLSTMLEQLHEIGLAQNFPLDIRLQLRQKLINYFNQNSLFESQVWTSRDVTLLTDIPSLPLNPPVSIKEMFWGATERQRLYRKSMEMILDFPDMFAKVYAHELKCNRSLSALTAESESVVLRLREVQLHEMQFLGEALMKGDDGITSEDVEKLGISHLDALESLEMSSRVALIEAIEKYTLKHQQLVLKLMSSFDSSSIREKRENPTRLEETTNSNDRISRVEDIPKDQLLKKGISALIKTKVLSKEEEPNMFAITTFLRPQWTDQKKLQTVGIGEYNKCSPNSQYAESVLNTATESLDLFLGAQLKNLFHLRVQVAVGGLMRSMCDLRLKNVGDAEKMILRSSENLRFWRKISLEHIYDSEMAFETISAVALPKPECSTLVFNERFMAASNYSAELHFQSGNNSCARDVGVSWHSNLGMGIICALHGQSSNKDEAIKHVILEAIVQGVSHLIIPLREWVLEYSTLQKETESMKSGHFERSPLNPKLVARMFRAVKSTLGNAAHKNKCGKLQSITFLLKSVCSSDKQGEEVVVHVVTNSSNEASKSVVARDIRNCSRAKALLEKIFEN